MKKRLLSLLLSGCISLSTMNSASALNTDLPDLGNSARSLVSSEQERELGRAFMRSVRKNQAVMDDPLISDYIQQLGEQLLEQSNSAGQPFDFFVINNRQINAFAGPGGHIGIFTGLILITQTESELASVLAHEIAHVSQQHLARAWELADNLSIPNAAVLLAAIALGVVVGGDAGIAAAAGGQAALIQNQINFTRANEKEADRIGVGILAGSNFEPRAMPAFFSRMGKANRTYATKLPEYLLTHPVSTSRTADSLGRAEQHPYRQPKTDLRYQLARVQLKQQSYTDPSVAIANYDRLLSERRYRNKSATEYGRALALLRADRIKEAENAFKMLLKQHPKQLEFIVMLAKAEEKLGDTESALTRLQNALYEKPSSFALNLSYAETALSRGEFNAALNQLKKYIEYHRNDPKIYELMSRAAGENGNTLLAHEYLSEKHYLDGDLEAAILQLEIALKNNNIDFYQSSKIESRLNQLKQEEKQNKKHPLGNKFTPSLS